MPNDGIMLALAALAGLLAGGLNFAALAFNTRLYLGGASPLVAFALQALRMAVIAAVLIAMVRLGAMALLAAFIGFLAARQVAIGLARKP